MAQNSSQGFYVGGDIRQGQSELAVVNPATELTVAHVAAAEQVDVIAALTAAQNVAQEWREIGYQRRAEWMTKLKHAVMSNEDHLRHCVHLEMAKPWSDTEEDFSLLVDSLDYYSDMDAFFEPQQLNGRDHTYAHTLVKRPAGVVGAFLAWNFPLLNLAYKLGPCMAAGCPIVIKPSSQTPLSAYAVGQICSDIDLPAGVVNILSGDDAEIGDTISQSTVPAVLTLIGSTQTGKHVMAKGATSIKKYAMELGGNAPAIVFADADLDLAADVICALKFGNAGQICVAPNRVLVDASAEKALCEKIVSRAKAVRVGFDRHVDIDMGPVINRQAWERIDGLVNDAIASGAQLLAGGGRPEGMDSGHFYAPTVLNDVNSDMALSCTEVFGPVVSIRSFSDADAVLDIANNTDAGLSAFVFSQDEDLIERCVSGLHFGEIQINGVKYGIELPHVGIRQSGIGADCSQLALDDYLVSQRISRPANN